MTDEGAAVYRALLPLARLLAAVFHRNVEVRQRAHVPREGPVILAANHPNMLLDVLLVAVSQPRPVHFLGKSTLFANPWLGGWLRAAGVLPVYRRRDAPGESSANELTFAACHDLLERGGAIAIFPEGVSHGRNAVLPLKTGCARIALEAEAKNGFELGVRIVPVGLAFSSRELFRSDALVTFGEPIDPASSFEAYRRGGAEAAEAVRALTGMLEHGLRAVAPHVPDERDELLVGELSSLFAEEGDGLGARIEIDRTLVEAVRFFRETSPVRFARLRRRVLRYGRIRRLLGISHGQMDRRYRVGSVLRYVGPRAFFAAAGFLPFLAGAGFFYLPYKVPAWIAQASRAGRVEAGTVKLLAGLICFPAFYLLGVLVVGRLAGARAAWLTAALAPALGLFALAYREALDALIPEARAFFLHVRDPQRTEGLRRWRRDLVGELASCRLEFERWSQGSGAAPFGPDDPGNPRPPMRP